MNYRWFRYIALTLLIGCELPVERHDITVGGTTYIGLMSCPSNNMYKDDDGATYVFNGNYVIERSYLTTKGDGTRSYKLTAEK